jgi:NAD(P)-dependent dehydrogenase (short-subunit alcohol dehydrogenase family)
MRTSAIVTGGGSGLGQAIAGTLAGLGHHVVVADVDGDAAIRVAGEVGGTAVTADVTVPAQVDSMVSTAVGAGPLKVLVLSAAIETRTSIVDCTDEEWQRVLDVNLKGPFLCLRAALPRMVEAGGGSVIALGSTLGIIAAPGYPAYCTSKGALTNLCKQAAIEHAGDGIRVNVLAPSAHEAGLFMKMTEQAPDPAGLRSRIAAAVPMGRLGRVDDVCAAVRFLASDDSAYLSGAVIPLDGGLAARRL